MDVLIEKQGQHAWQLITEHLDEKDCAFFSPYQPWLQPLLTLSDFLTQVVCKTPEIVMNILRGDELNLEQRDSTYPYRLKAIFEDIKDQPCLYRQIRHFRQREMWIIAARDLSGRASVEETLIHLSALADTIILQTLNFLYKNLVSEYGAPEGSLLDVCPLCVIALGKLGAQELNFSSDIDLIFVYPQSGHTKDGRRSISHQEFFTRLGQKLILALSEITQDGFVFRVDMRLRPFGDDGPLVMSFHALEDYYQQHGRYWERFALVKKRILGHQQSVVQQLNDILQPFIYRRYLDYSVIYALQDLKSQIIVEVRRRHLEYNIKLGCGGIREIEFVVQALQLIRGGRQVQLQTPRLLDAIKALYAENVIDQNLSEQLSKDYLWLRNLENRLQMIRDQQTHNLPEQELDQQRIVYAFQAKNWQEILDRYKKISQRTHQTFLHIIGPPTVFKQQVPHWWYIGYKQIMIDASQSNTHLSKKFLKFSQDFISYLKHVSHELYQIKLQPGGERARRDLLPLIFYESCILLKSNLETLRRLALILKAIMGRTPYLELLLHNLSVRRQLIKLASSHLMLAEQLAKYPILLDELLVPSRLYTPVLNHGYRQALQAFMLRLVPDDVEQRMEALRQFKQIQLLRISAAEFVYKYPVMKVSNYLSWLAECILDDVVEMAFEQMKMIYGVPADLNEQDKDIGLLILGYGKLGGLELGYQSDLDLVFLRDERVVQPTNGLKSIEPEQFYHRLVQKILHIFNARMINGILYQIDIRLRPDGEAGLLCPTVQSWENYLNKKAWTWELQALVRARCLYGSTNLMERVNNIRQHRLIISSDPVKIQEDICQMRDKIRHAQVMLPDGKMNLKHTKGGLIDIEFFAQKIVLLFARDEGSLLTQWTDTVRILDAAVLVGLLPFEQMQRLKHAYLLLRQALHQCSLEQQPGVINQSQLNIDLDLIAQDCNYDFELIY